ncbi:MAG: hypothetical protein NT159_00585 [Proteobacteria bacterium]|nr:hypothetical protein [Pseudomonadota bacterium]
MLTKEQRAAAAQELASPYGRAVHLLCDGRRVSLQVQCASKTGLKYRVMTFVDGQFMGAWCKGDTPEAKFLRKHVHSLVSPARYKQAEKVFGKRAVAKDPFWNKTFTQYHPDWASGKAAIDHLCKACESVEFAPEMKA